MSTHDTEPSDVFATAWDVFRRIVDNCPVGIFTADVSGRHVFVNRHWSVLTGVSRGEAVGRGWERAVHPEDVRAVARQWRQLATEGDELSIQIRLLQPDGTARPAILRAAAVVGENGHRRFAGTLTAMPDGTDSRPPEHGHPDLDGLAALSGMFPDTIDLLRAELDRFDMVTDDFWFPPVHGTEPAGPNWTVPSPRRPAPGEVGPPAADATDPWRVDPSVPPFTKHTLPEPQPGDQPGSRNANAENPGAKKPGAIDPGVRNPNAGNLGAGNPGAGHPGADQPGAEPSGAVRPSADDFPSVRRPGAAAPRGGALPPGAEWRAAVTPHGVTGGMLEPPTVRSAGSGSQPPRPSASAGPASFAPFSVPAWPAQARPPATHRPGGGGGCGCTLAEMRRLSAACHERERWLTALLAELPSAVLIADADAQVVAVNQIYCDLFELAEAPVDLVGADCRAHLRPLRGLVEDPAGFAHRLDTLLRRRRTTRRETVMFADGRVFERSHIPLAGPDGYHGHVWLYVDVTDRRIVEAEIEGLISGL